MVFTPRLALALSVSFLLVAWAVEILFFILAVIVTALLSLCYKNKTEARWVAWARVLSSVSTPLVIVG